MSSTRFFCTCITNNSDLKECVSDIEYIDGTIIDVIKKARDLVHMGWSLASNPLYGNLKPNQQPYRTIVLTKEKTDKNLKLNVESLTYLEQAIRIYENAPVLVKPGQLKPESEADFRYLDFNLLEETLRKCSILTSVLTRTTDGRTIIK
ncbi:MAG: GrdX family protein [Synergistaceae bacterium]